MTQAAHELETLTTQLCEKESTIIQLTEKLGTISSQLETMTSENENLLAVKEIVADELSSVKAAYATLESSLDNEKSMVEGLSRKLETAEADMIRMSDENIVLSKKIVTLETELSDATCTYMVCCRTKSSFFMIQ